MANKQNSLKVLLLPNVGGTYFTGFSKMVG